MCRGYIELTKERVREGIMGAVAYGNREGLTIESVSVGKSEFNVLSEGRVVDYVELETCYGKVIVFRGRHD